MAVNFTGDKTNQTEVAEILQELYAESFTMRDGLVDIDEGHKSGADVYESSATVTQSAHNTGPVTATGDIDLNANKTAVSLSTYNYEDIIDENSLKGTRFERSMKAGAFNIVSDEFDKKVLIQVAPAIGEDVENQIWNGATTATKAAVAALTPGAAQGSISAGAQTLVAAMPTRLLDSLPTVILYNASNAKAVPGAGLGDYIKVPSIAGSITAANIGAEYEKMYLAAPSKAVNHRAEPARIFAPLAHRQLIKVANNQVSATADNKNFVIEGSGENEVISYNGHIINFVPLDGFMIFAIPSYLKVLTDLMSDVSALNIGQEANGSQRRYIKNIQSMATWCVGQKYITLYGG